VAEILPKAAYRRCSLVGSWRLETIVVVFGHSGVTAAEAGCGAEPSTEQWSLPDALIMLHGLTVRCTNMIESIIYGFSAY